MAIDYRRTESHAAKKGRALGLGAQYAVGGGVDFYAGFNSYSFDASGEDLESIHAIHVGSRVMFD